MSAGGNIAPTPPAGWRYTGILATVVVLLSIPLYLSRGPAPVEKSEGASARFVGSQNCRDCHRPQYDLWAQSHHRWAMAEATQETVKGDFNDVVFEKNGIRSKFYRRDNQFFVHTQGPKGKMEEFEIRYTFGWTPLQQYLIAFPGGRLQCLPIAWDVHRRQWYHLYPDNPPPPDDWLHWTNQAQNWNGMCAECHSTDLKKNYDPTTDTFNTTWSEISVGCEACHGPGSAHVGWAQMPEMGRPHLKDAGLTVSTRNLSARQQIELCAPCHSRRMSLDDNIHRHADFLDYGIPQLLTENMYFADGQILDEVYVYGSFMQSKMYARDVRCSDCHDVHSGHRQKKGNALCLQCHRAAAYDTKAHHFHKKKGEAGQPIRSASGEILFEVGSGAQCEQCHMPGRNYMGIDYRPDHSFRVPRPDLSPTIDTPNACNRCHVGQTTRWSIDAVQKWYGPSSKRAHYGRLLDAGRKRQPEALTPLIGLSQDRLYPTIVRATALALIGSYHHAEGQGAIQRALSDEEALMRQTAAAHFNANNERMLQHLGPLLYDPVRAVRIEAARRLTAIPAGDMPKPLSTAFLTALSDYRNVMERSADFPASRHNLGNLNEALGNTAEAISQYQKAFAMDPAFYPAKVNLAMLYNRQGRNEDGKKLFSEVVRDHPDLHEVKYSFGLLLAEMKEFERAADVMAQAASGLPQRSRIHYNLSLLRQRLNQDREAEASLQRALALEPQNPDYLYALAVFYFQKGLLDPARAIAQRMLTLPATHQMGQQLINAIDQRRAKSTHSP